MWPNVHTWHPECSWTTKIFTVQLILAALLVLGFFTNSCSLVLWFLYCSQYRRNPYATSGGDALLRISCLWCGLMSTAGAHASLDRALWPTEATRAPGPVVDVASLGQRLLVTSMYFSSAIFKHNARIPRHPDQRSPWIRGDAVRIAFACCDYLTWFGDILRRQHALCCLLTWSTLVIEYLAPILLFTLDGAPRMLLVVVLMCMHITMGLAMNLENFSFVCLACLPCFLPSWFWEYLSQHLCSTTRGNTKVYYKGGVWCPVVRCFLEIFLLGSIHCSKKEECDNAFKGHHSSWVLKDEHGTYHSGVEAVGLLLSLSPFWIVSYPILQMYPADQDPTRTGDRASSASHLNVSGLNDASVSASSYTLKAFKIAKLTCSIATRGVLPMFCIFVSMHATYKSHDKGWEHLGNAHVINLDNALVVSATKLGLQVKWNMFDAPPRECGWYVLPSLMQDVPPYNGTLVDVHKVKHYPGDNSSVSWARPEWPTFQHKSALWHAFYELLYSPAKTEKDRMEFLTESLTRYYCRNFPIKTMHVVFSIERYNFIYYNDTVLRNRTLWAKSCKAYDKLGRIPEKKAYPESGGKFRRGPPLP